MEIKGKVILKRDRLISVQRFHPWIFSGAVQSIEGKVEDGCWVEVEGKGNILGYGHYHQGSIAVRILQFGGVSPATNSTFWQDKFTQALILRKASQIPSQDTNCYRLIHGEGDGLSGLIVDIYNGVAVVQSHTRGMLNSVSEISTALQETLGSDLTAIYFKDKSDRADPTGSYVAGIGVTPHIVLENSTKFFVDWEEGQKTGFFVDQRENRKLLASYVRGKTVLNTFGYTGGFSVYAIAAGAAAVHTVDASERAIVLARKNIELNGYDPHMHSCVVSDAFSYIKANAQNYDVMVLDPPAFAKHISSRHQAIKGYQRLNIAAMQAIKPNGILFTFSCSQVVDKKLFFDTVVSSAMQAGRQVKALHQLSQPPDHPISMFHPEGEYLKGLVLFVE